MADQAAPPQIRQHVWTEMTFSTVEVLGMGSDGQLAVFPTEEPKTGVSCIVCHAALTELSQSMACPGESIADDEEPT